MGSWKSGAGREHVSGGIRKNGILTRAWSLAGTAGLEAFWSSVFNRGLEGEIFIPGRVYMFTSREDKPKVQVGVVEKVKGTDYCSDREKCLRKLALDLEIVHLLKALKKQQPRMSLKSEQGSNTLCCCRLHLSFICFDGGLLPVMSN